VNRLAKLVAIKVAAQVYLGRLSDLEMPQEILG
jgi:hypothetical protein